jgi:PhnB protein
MKKNEPNRNITSALAPWLTVANCVAAANFYKHAFDAAEKYRLETPDGLVVKLAVGQAEFWVSGGFSDDTNSNQSLGGGSVRMILTVTDPEAIFNKALTAGASQIFPVAVAHGWRLGRLVDPFGLHWEIGHPVDGH